MTRAILPEIKGYLLSNRVRVFTCFPNVALPKGTVVLPISEDKWAVVALDFPNENISWGVASNLLPAPIWFGREGTACFLFSFLVLFSYAM